MRTDLETPSHDQDLELSVEVESGEGEPRLG